MSALRFDPDSNKVENSFGGYDSNEKGIVQYPQKPYSQHINIKNAGHPDRPRSSYICCAVGSTFKENGVESKFYSKPKQDLFSNSITNPIEAHYRIFMEDPTLNRKDPSVFEETDDKQSPNQNEVSACGIKNLNKKSSRHEPTAVKKPIDPIHWKSDLFDNKLEKYYLRNLMIEDPYRPFLTSCYKESSSGQYCTEYKLKYSGNPTLSASSSRILGISSPTDIPEPCQNWKRYKTQKLKDVVFTQDRAPLESNLNPNDPQRYNPWPRLKMSYDLMLGANLRPRPLSGVEYSKVTLLPAVSSHSKLWII